MAPRICLPKDPFDHKVQALWEFFLEHSPKEAGAESFRGLCIYKLGVVFLTLSCAFPAVFLLFHALHQP